MRGVILPDCSELAKAVFDASVILSRTENISDIDSLVKRLQEAFPELTRQRVVDSIVEATTTASENKRRVVSALTQLKREARTDKRLRDAIDNLTAHLEEGTLPAKKPRVVRTQSQAITELRQYKNDLLLQLRNSEPALIAKYDARIKSLTDKLENKNYAPAKRIQDTPQSKEITRRQFRINQLEQQIRRKIQAQRKSTWLKQGTAAGAAWKSLAASVDASAVGVQGFFLGITHPTKVPGWVRQAYNAAKTEQGAFELEQELLNRDITPYALRSGLFISSEETGREDEIISQVVEELPIIAGSARFHTAYLNTMRMDVFESMVNSLPDAPTLDRGKVIANSVNVLTLRGKLKALEGAMDTLNAFMWSPRKLIAEGQILFGNPIWGGKYDTDVVSARKAVARQYARFGLGMGSFLGLAALMLGTDEDKDNAVIVNPLSPDFLRVKIYGRYYNPLGGLAGVIRLAIKYGTALLGEGKKQTRGGEEIILTGPEQDYGQSLWGESGKFIRGRGSPGSGLSADIITQKDYKGDPLTLQHFLVQPFPLSTREIGEALKDEGVPASIVPSILGFFGQSSFRPPKRKKK